MSKGVTHLFPFLNQIGLTHSEITVYLTLIRISGYHTNGTISKRSELKQSTTSNALSSLIRKGLVSTTIKNGHTFYFSEDPQKLLTLISERARELEKSFNDAKSVVAELKSLEINEISKPKIRYFEGVDAVKGVFLEMMDKDDDIYGYCSMYKEVDEAYEDFWDYYYSLVLNKNKKIHLIVTDTEEARAFKLKNSEQKKEIKLVPQEKYSFPSEKHISGDFVAEISLQSDVPTVVLIEDRHIADSERSFFKLAWDLI